MNIKASVIIPTCNRADQLSVTLKSLVSLDFDANQFEIIVVDNGSTDHTKTVVKSFIDNYSQIEIKYFYDSVPGLLTGRHRGAHESKSEILVFIDDDIEADKVWLSAIVNAFENPNVHLVGGKNLPKYESKQPDWLEYFWREDDNGKYCGWLSLADLGNETKEIDPNFVWGLNFSIRKKTLFELGGFHPDCIPSALQCLQGDGETGLTEKIKTNGYKALYVPEAMVYHVVPKERLTSEYFEKRAFYQGVCDSFTEIRRKGEIQIPDVRSRKEKSSSRSKIQALKNHLASFFFKRTNSNPGSEYEIILAKTKQAYLSGYNFHQNAVINNSEILNWIMKEDYFDYQLPKLYSK